MHGDTLDERRQHVRLADRALARVEQVAVQDREVRELPDRQRAGLVEMVRVGRPGRGRGQDVDELQRARRGRNGSLGSPRDSSLTRVTATSIWRNGSGVETLQSEPMTSVAPFAPERAERVLAGGDLRSQDRAASARPSGPRAPPSRAARWRGRPAGGTAAGRPGGHLEVGEVRPRVGPAVGAPGGLDGVERLADRAVAERVEVGLEPERVDADDGLRQDLGIDEVEAAVVGRVAVDVEVGLRSSRRSGSRRCRRS